MKLSVIYPTCGRPELLVRSIRALLDTPAPPDEIIVVDQSRTDETRVALTQFKEFGIIHIPSEERGLSRARNTGIRQCKNPIIGFLDDDCIPAPEWTVAGHRAIERTPNSSVWIGEDVDDDVMIAPSVMAGIEPGDTTIVNARDPWRIGPTGGNSVFRKSVFDTVGLFDPLLGQGSIFPGAEDGDIVYRVLKHNLQITYTNTICCYHIDWRSDIENAYNCYNYGLGVGAMMAKYAGQGDYYLATIVFARRFLIKYVSLPWFLILGRKNKFLHNLKWAQGITHGYLRWRRMMKTAGVPKG